MLRFAFLLLIIIHLFCFVSKQNVDFLCHEAHENEDETTRKEAQTLRFNCTSVNTCDGCEIIVLLKNFLSFLFLFIVLVSVLLPLSLLLCYSLPIAFYIQFTLLNFTLSSSSSFFFFSVCVCVCLFIFVLLLLHKCIV